MKVLERFSENQKNDLLYEQRLDAERVELAWKAMLEQERQAKEHERQEKERLLALLRKADINSQQP